MYIRANEGLGQGPLHYRVGDATPFLNQVEQGEPKPCKPRFFVTHFLPGSSKLLRLHRKIIGDIAKNVVRFLQSQKVQAGIKGKADVALVFHFEGHVDKKTDPATFGTLDMDRASEVAFVLNDQIGKVINPANFSLLMSNQYSAAGSQPISTNSRTNRGVVICVRSVKVKAFQNP